VTTSLALLLRGSRGKTAAEIHENSGFVDAGLISMEHVTKGVKSFIDFLFSETDEAWNQVLPAVNTTIPKPSPSDSSKFLMINSLWVSTNQRIAQAFIAEATKNYATEVKGINFSRGSDRSQQIMENWLFKQSQQSVSSCAFRENNIASNEGLLSSSALILKLIPEHELWGGNITRRDFYSLGKYIKKMTFFEKTSNLRTRYSSLFKSLILEIKLKPPTTSRLQISVIFMLPDSKHTIGFLENKLKSADILLREVTKGLRYTMTHVKLPILFPRVSLKVSRLLPFIGIEKLFTPRAQLQNISAMKNIFIQEMLQDINVDIRLAVADASTSSNSQQESSYPVLWSSLQGTSYPKRYTDNHEKQFIANKPFIYLILEKTSNSILFLGRVNSL
jgi:serine protease inhibitor